MINFYRINQLLDDKCQGYKFQNDKIIYLETF